MTRNELLDKLRYPPDNAPQTAFELWGAVLGLVVLGFPLAIIGLGLAIELVKMVW